LNQEYMVRKLTGHDLNELMVIENDSFSMPWSRQSYENELKNQWAEYLVCDWGGELAAFGGMWTVYEESHITNLAVAKKYRGRGLGRVLMQELERLARAKRANRILLEVRPSNTPALDMYKKLGYIPISVRREYYEDNREDALVMIKHLI